MRKYKITNLEELRVARQGLKIEYTVKQSMLKADVGQYLKQFTPSYLLKKYLSPGNISKADDKFNLSGMVMSFVLPTFMNKTIFRKAGFLTKTAVGLIGNKLGKSLDIEHLSGLFNTVKAWFDKPKPIKKKEKKFVDYGIPPDSETY